MKKLFVFITILGITKLHGQQTNEYTPYEISIALNRSAVNDDNTENRTGFGMGLNYTFRSEKALNIMFGIEYNKTSQFKKSLNHNRQGVITNATYDINSIALPVGFRYTIGKKIKCFVSTGAFFDLNVNATKTGTLILSADNEDGTWTNIEETYTENEKLSDAYGLYFGIGLKIPISKHELIIKNDYKHAFNVLDSAREDLFNRYIQFAIGFRPNFN